MTHSLKPPAHKPAASASSSASTRHPLKPAARTPGAGAVRRHPLKAAAHRPGVAGVARRADPPPPVWPTYTGVSQFVGTSADGRVNVYVDPTLGTSGLQNAQDLVNDAPRVDFADDSLFGATGGPVSVIVFALNGATDGTGGADHDGCDFATGAAIEVDASFGSSDRVSALYEAELSECMMGGNLCGVSTGEALSRWCAMATSNNALADFATAPFWAADGMPDFVSALDTTDQNPASTGCGMAFLSWLQGKLGFALSSIAQAMVALGDTATLADLYNNLTGDAAANAFPNFLADVQALTGGVTSDDPFNSPILSVHWPTFPGTAQYAGTSADALVNVYFDPTLGASGLQNAQDLVNDAPRVDFDNEILFGSGGPVSVVVFALNGATDGTGGADHGGCDFATGAAIEADASFGSSDRVSALYEAELSECTMGGNLCGVSTGEALSRWCAMATSNNALSDFATAPFWAASGMPDFVTVLDPTDQNPVSTGCGMAFLSWLQGNLGFPLSNIAQSMVALGDTATLADLYNNLTGDAAANAFPNFLADVQALAGGVTSDDPFNGLIVLLARRFAGVARRRLPQQPMTGKQAAACTAGSRRLLPPAQARARQEPRVHKTRPAVAARRR